MQKKLMPGSDPNFDKLPNGVDDDGDWDFNDTVGEKSAQRVGVKRRLQDI